jgi:hypothetical protein
MRAQKKHWHLRCGQIFVFCCFSPALAWWFSDVFVLQFHILDRHLQTQGHFTFAVEKVLNRMMVMMPDPPLCGVGHRHLHQVTPNKLQLQTLSPHHMHT